MEKEYVLLNRNTNNKESVATQLTAILMFLKRMSISMKCDNKILTEMIEESEKRLKNDL